MLIVPLRENRTSECPLVGSSIYYLFYMHLSMVLANEMNSYPRVFQCFYRMSISYEIIKEIIRDLHLFPILPCMLELRCHPPLLFSGFWLSAKTKDRISIPWPFFRAIEVLIQCLTHPLKHSLLLSSIVPDDETDNGITMLQSYALKYLAESKFHYFNIPLTTIWTFNSLWLLHKITLSNSGLYEIFF